MEKEILKTGKPSVDKPWLKWYSDEALNVEIADMKFYDYMKLRNLGNLNGTALNYFNRKITYGEMIKEIEKTAAAFEKLGVKPGEIVTFCTPTLPETIYAIYALNKIGAIAALIDPTTNSERIENFINLFDSKHLVMVDVAYPKFEKFLAKTNLTDTIVISPADSLSPLMKLGYNVKKMVTDIKKETTKLDIPYGDYYINWHQFMELGNNYEATDAPFKPNSPAAIVLTSGTTGVPKGAVMSSENLNAIALEQGYCTNMEKNDTFLNIMPPFIAYGLVCGVNNVLCNGLEMIIIPKFEKGEKKAPVNGKTPKIDKANTFDTLLMKHNPQHVLGVPNFYTKLAESDKADKLDLSFLKCCIAGGDTFHSKKEELVNSFLKAHHSEVLINKGYGMTELCSVATYTTDANTNKLGSVGIPVMLNNVKILDLETGEELGYNQVGELYVSGPGVILGYFGNEKESKRTFITDDNGIKWVKTDDLFSIDEDGVLFFHGRIKRMMVRPDGHNVFNEPIEEVLLSHVAVEDCAVIGVEDKNATGEIPSAVVVLKEQYRDLKDEVEKQLRALSLEKLPERDVALDYYYRDSLPYTLVSKVDYQKLKKEIKDKVLIKNK